MGFEGVRMRIVAARAEVSSALLHYHFENREKLFLAAMRFSFEHAGAEDYETSRPGRSAPPPGGWPGSSTPACRSTPNCAATSCSGRSCGCAARATPSPSDLAQDLYLELREWVGAAIRDGIAAGEFTPATWPRSTDLLLALADGYGIRLVLDDPVLTLDRARTQIWAAIARELGITRPFPLPDARTRVLQTTET